MTHNSAISMIGLGAMGMPMARNILKAGFPLRVWGRHAERAKPLLDEGAQWAESPAALATSSDVVILMVTNSPDVEELITAPGGILEGSHAGLTIVDMSTIAPDTSRRMAELARERSVDFLDAPVSGGTQGAESGALTIMVGGDESALNRVRPVLEVVGKKIFHVGPVGSGEIVKLANNVLVGAIAAATAEALVLGAKAGADVGIMAEVIGASAGGSWQLANQFPLRVFNGSFQPGFMTDLLAKDLDLALDLGAAAQSPLFLTALTRQLFGEVQAAGFGRHDYTSIVRILEQVAGTKVRTQAED